MIKLTQLDKYFRRFCYFVPRHGTHFIKISALSLQVARCNQALETYRISYLLFFRTCVTLFRLRPELQPSDTIYGHIHRNSIFHTTFKD